MLDNREVTYVLQTVAVAVVLCLVFVALTFAIIIPWTQASLYHEACEKKCKSMDASIDVPYSEEYCICTNKRAYLRSMKDLYQ